MLVRIDFKEKVSVSRYDTELDKLVAVPVENGSVTWNFSGVGTAIFITGSEPKLPVPKTYAGKPSLKLTNGWTVCRSVSHEAGRSDFVIRKIDEEPVAATLGDWRPKLGETLCGQAVYRIEFASEGDCEVEVDLGKVYWCAGIRLNGIDCSNRFFGPFKWEVKLAKGRNVLEVTVANLLSTLLGNRAIRSRIAADYPPSPNYESRQRPADLQNRESGLFEPVVIRN